MTLEQFMREKCGRKCYFKFNCNTCSQGRIWADDSDEECCGGYNIDCPHCLGTGYEPTTLEDVMQEFNKIDMFAGMPFMIASNGCVYKHGKIILEWTLGKPFSSQSEETQQAVGRLLGWVEDKE